MKLASVFRYAVSDLRHRPVATFLNVAAVALAAAYILVLGFYGASIHRYQRDVLDASLPNKIVASVPSVSEGHLRFTPERVTQVAELPGVELAFPCIELNVEMALAGGRALDVLADGTVSGDPSLAPSRLAWGTGVTGADAREVVISRRVFERLGGRLTGAPSPASMVLSVHRTVDGQDETQQLELSIAGVLETQPDERVHVPLELLRNLNWWCTNRIDTLTDGAREREGSKVRYASCFAYTEPSAVDRVAAEAQHLEVHTERSGGVTVFDAGGPLWAVIERAGDDRLDARDRATVATVAGTGELWESKVGVLGGVRIVALSANDPRWSVLDPGADPGPRPIFTGPDGHAALDPALRGVTELPADRALEADIVCDADGYERAFFVPRTSDAVEPFCWIETTDIAAGAALAGERGAAPAFGEDVSWAFFGAEDESPPAPAGARRGLQSGSWSQASVAASHSAAGRSVTWAVRTVPEPFLAACVGGFEEPAEGEPLGFVHVTPDPALPIERLWMKDREVRGLEQLHLFGATESLWMVKMPAGARIERSGRLLWGRWDELLRVLAADHSGPVAGSALPSLVGVVLAGSTETLARRLGPSIVSRSRMIEFPGVRSRLRVSTRDEPAVLASALELGSVTPGSVHLRSRGDMARRRAILVGEAWESAPLHVHTFADLAPKLAILSEEDYRSAAWNASSRSEQAPGRTRYEVRVRDAARFATLQRELAASGLELRSLTELRARELERVRVTDPGSHDGLVGADLIAVLRMSQPTFVDARATLAVTCETEVEQRELELVGTDAGDPERFANLPLSGIWLSDSPSANQVLLPRALLAEGSAPREAVGRALAVRFTRDEGSGSEDSLIVPLEVVGVVDGDRAFAPRELLEDVALWRRGRVVYNETRGSFESPFEVSQRSGDLRCNVFAAGQENVPATVAALNAQGYRTEDRLADQGSLRRLGRVLGFLVGFFVLGCVVNAAITVFVATMMNVKSKTFEIGILRAHGVRRSQVVGIFASQGLAVGALAFALSAALVWFLEPRLRSIVRQVFALQSDGLLAGSPFAAELWWLPVTALTVALAFSFGGVVLPAAFASRLSPVEALRRRE
ncbi:MAG: hypothetical protein GY711_21760 [bacterium]|nr:hypothetical protein [bacterium]